MKHPNMTEAYPVEVVGDVSYVTLGCPVSEHEIPFQTVFVLTNIIKLCLIYSDLANMPATKKIY